MPVIREQFERHLLSDEKRDSLRRRLSEELGSTPATGDGPVLFEIPIDGTEHFDAIAVWDAWEGVHAKDRTAIILDAYRAVGRVPSLAMGVTFEEAKDQGLLPYRVRLLHVQPYDQKPADEEIFRHVGGFRQSNGEFLFRYPTEKMAFQAVQELQRAFPGTTWSVPSFSISYAEASAG